MRFLNSEVRPSEALDFYACVITASRNAEYVEQWQRLRGVRLLSTPFEQLLDEATGNLDCIASLFIADVYDLVFRRMH